MKKYKIMYASKNHPFDFNFLPIEYEKKEDARDQIKDFLIYAETERGDKFQIVKDNEVIEEYIS